MQTFHTNKPKTIRKVIIDFSLAVMILLIYWFLRVRTNSSAGSEYLLYALIVVLALQLIATLLRKRILEIGFDEDDQILFVIEKNFISQATNKKFSLTQVVVEIDRWKPLIGPEKVVLYFLRGKVELFELNFRKDGFTSENLLKVTASAKALSIPVKRY